MCGGEGSRLRSAVGDTEKPLVEVGGEPMVGRIVSALRKSEVTDIVAAVSPATPATAAFLDDRGVRRIKTPGDGYVADLDAALDHLKPPTVTVAADLPLVTAAHVDRAIAAADGDSLTVCVPADLVSELGGCPEPTIEHEGTTVVPTGLNVVADGPDRRIVRHDERLACNVNRPADLRAAEAWLAGESSE